MNKIAVAALVVFSNWSGLWAQPRNILTRHYTVQSLSALIKPAADFHPCPVAGEWKGLDEKIRQRYIKDGEKYLNTNWGELKAMIYMEYKRNGNRSNFELLTGTRTLSLNTLVLAEMLEGKKRFIPDIVNGVWAICEESYWGSPASNLQKDQSGLPDIAEPSVDIFSAETAALLAWTEYLLKPALDSVSPLICRRITMEVNRRIWEPLAQRKDFWWMGYKEWPFLPNNWNPWIMSNYLATVLFLEKDPVRRGSAVYRCMEILDNFLNLYNEDGGCNEGPGYWFAAAASLFDSLDLLEEASGGKISFKDSRLIAAMEAYIYKVYIGKKDYFVNFADAGPKLGIALDGGLMYRYGKYMHDSILMKFGALIARDSGLMPNIYLSAVRRKVRSLQMAKEILEAPAADPLIRDSWFPNLQVMTARSNAGSIKGFYVAAKGGHNAESHNHNDVGSFIVYADAEPLLIDLGPETYTGKTFSAQRYDIWAMQSQYHNLPSINGVMQKDGKQYAAAGVSYHQTDKEAVLSMDISKAYPPEAKLEKWKRTITLKRNKSVNIRDAYKLAAFIKPVNLYFMTNHTADTGTPGKIILTKNGRSFEMLYDKSVYTARSENVFEGDRENSSIKIWWGTVVNRIILTAKQVNLESSSELVIRYAGNPGK